MTFRRSILTTVAAIACLVTKADAGILGTAEGFAVLGGSMVTNTGASVITGDVGVSPGTSITGSGTATVSGTVHMNDAVAMQAQTDLAAAFSALSAMAPTQDLTGQNLGGMTLMPGVYAFSSSAQLTGTLTLNDQGNPNAQFVFLIGSTLTTASNSSVVTTDGNPLSACSVFFQVGSSATLGTDTAFEGHILALTSITLNTGASILDGSALALHGAVTLDTNTITDCVSADVTAAPEPATMTLILIGGATLGLPTLARRLRGRRTRNVPPPDASFTA